MNAQAKVLVVDDEEVVRKSFARVLRGADCQVETVSGWHQAAPLLQREPFDVVLLDLRMPETDGMTVLRRVKQQWPDSEVIVVTGYPTVDTAKEAVALGASDYLMKPVAPDQVIEATRAAVTHKRWALHRQPDSVPDASAAARRAASPERQANL